jgi:hypothetical protein
VVSLVSTLAAVALAAALVAERSAPQPLSARAVQPATETFDVAREAAQHASTAYRSDPQRTGVVSAVSGNTGWAAYAGLRNEILSKGTEILPRPASAPLAPADAVMPPQGWIPGQRTAGSRRSAPGNVYEEGGLL